MEELIPVNILVGDRNYRVKIKPADEENLRKTIKLVNNKLVEFKTNFAGKDMQDYIAMVLIWLATEQPSSAITNENAREISGKLKALQQLIEEAI
ncbi:cell division protein ZapA [Parafilimonas sp.]|jgi:cell division protein ZapA|uniref:cell division protein ZapA n=1 Tax=Parafilimonas sp. TaxID=1969739 RepID=UPI003F8169D3